MESTGIVGCGADWSSGRGSKSRNSRSRDSSICVSTNGTQFEESQGMIPSQVGMIQSLAIGVQNVQKSTAFAAAEAKKEQASTTKAITSMGNDVKKVAEDFGETQKLLEKTNQRVEKVEESLQERAKKIQEIEENLAKGYVGKLLSVIQEEGKHWIMILLKEKRAMVAILYFFKWMGGLGSKDGDYEGQC